MKKLFCVVFLVFSVVLTGEAQTCWGHCDGGDCEVLVPPRGYCRVERPFQEIVCLAYTENGQLEAEDHQLCEGYTHCEPWDYFCNGYWPV